MRIVQEQSMKRCRMVLFLWALVLHLCLLPLIESFTIPNTINNKNALTANIAKSRNIHTFPKEFHQQQYIMPSFLSASSALSQDSMEKPNKGQKRRFETWSNFMYGVHHVDSQYLHLFWEYYIRQPFLWVIPASVVFLAAQYMAPTSLGYYYSPYNLLNQFLQWIFFISSFVGGMLQLPLDAFRWVWHSSAAVTIPALEYLPNSIAIPLVRTMLFLHYELRGISQSYLFASLAVCFWRPMIEEIQYRWILFRLFGQERQKQQQQKQQHVTKLQENVNDDDDDALTTDDDDDSNLVRFIPLDETTPIPTTNTDNENDDSTANGKNNATPKSSKRTTTATTTLSRRVLLSSMLFATTRLGWLCALPDTVFAPSVWKIGFVQSATAPYIWTVGFIQSVMAHFSSSVLSEWTVWLQNGLLLLALHQSISTFLMARHVFAPLYEERGIAASMGAHVAWTIGKATIPFRLLAKILPASARRSSNRR